MERKPRLQETQKQAEAQAQQAEKALELGIPYVSALDGALERIEDNSAEIVPE